MPLSLGRLRFGRNTTYGSLNSPQTPTHDAKGGIFSRSSSKQSPVSPTARFRSWFSPKRITMEPAANQPSGRPPTPTPHLALGSDSASDDVRPRRKLRRKPPPKYEEDNISKEEKQEQSNRKSKGKSTKKSDGAKVRLTEEECESLNSFANGIRGLVEQMENTLKRARHRPPMRHSGGTPLSPILEANEIDRDSELELEVYNVPRIVLRPPSDDEVTDLDYGEPQDPLALGDVDAGLEAEEDEEEMPIWNPDVAESIESAMAGFTRPTPSVSVGEIRADEGEVDDDTIESDLELENATAMQTESETEDELEYFSAPSAVVSPAEEEMNKMDITPVKRMSLHIRALDLASSSSDSLVSGSSNVHFQSNEDDIASLTTPSPSPHPSPHHCLSHPQATRSMLELSSTSTVRQRAASLPAGRERPLPPLPRRPSAGRRLLGHVRAAKSKLNLDLMPSGRQRASSLPPGQERSSLPPSTRRSPLRRFLGHRRTASSRLDVSPMTPERQTSSSLPTSRERPLPPLPQLAISKRRESSSKEECKEIDEPQCTIEELQHERARLEQELVSAKKRVKEQDGQLDFIRDQTSQLHEAVQRMMHEESRRVSATASTEENHPIVISIPQEASSESDVNENNTDAEPSARHGDAVPTTSDDADPLTTPPATPDRRVPVALCENAMTAETTRNQDDMDLLNTPQPSRGLVRRKSAGAASALGNLGLGRGQMRRRAGSADLKKLTTTVPYH